MGGESGGTGGGGGPAREREGKKLSELAFAAGL